MPNAGTPRASMSTVRRRLVALVLCGALGLVAPAVAVVPATAATPPVVSPLPAKGYGLSSYYGPRCMPVKGSSTYHLGQDMESSRGVDIDAVAAGKVTRAGTTSGGFGQWIVIDHTVGGVRFSSVYGHMLDGDRYVKVGQKVTKGQHIADVGSSGTSTSYHLHLEIWKGAYPSGTSTDPLPFLKARGLDLVKNARSVAQRTVPSSCTYYATERLNLRSGPSTSYRVLKVLPVNGRMTAKPGASSGYWLKVTYSGTTGWVHRDYASPSRTVTASTLRYVTPSTLIMRKTPSRSASTVVLLYRSQPVRPTGAAKNGWLPVTATGHRGYVETKYLATHRPATTLSYVTASSLNLRKGPSTATARIISLPRGKAVRHLKAPSGGWALVTASGKIGYVSTTYLSSRRP
ncbi:SH3 domain-containing protein [Cellulomonas sp. PhB143]|uniref:SH3 domain-containing protein n=1 Tax=Cellulomonas sp. PhB143 TaxID=2485186 RepID=UPI000F47DCEA|nr:SH3 domain-containing protein [Cellulomonas sp. PhB143]ROS79078.1 SH3 domain-containing protein [Cellulomonas sp. PhB143]